MLKGGVYSRKIPEPCARGSSRSWRDQDQKEAVLSLTVPTAYLKRQPQTHHLPGGQDLHRAQGPSGWRGSLRACGDGRSAGSLAPGRTTAGGSAAAARSTLYLRGHGAGRGGGDGTRGGTRVEGPRGRATSQKEGGDAGLWRAEVEGNGGALVGVGTLALARPRGRGLRADADADDGEGRGVCRA